MLFYQHVMFVHPCSFKSHDDVKRCILWWKIAYWLSSPLSWCFTFLYLFLCWKFKLTGSFTDYGVDKYDIGTGFGHFAIATPDVSSFYCYVVGAYIIKFLQCFIFFSTFRCTNLWRMQEPRVEMCLGSLVLSKVDQVSLLLSKILMAMLLKSFKELLLLNHCVKSCFVLVT